MSFERERMINSKDSYLPYGRQKITDEDINAVLNILKSKFLTQGPAVPEFEREVASKVKARHGVAVNSATSALHIGCLALGVRPGKRLWTSPISFVASANCGRYCSAEIDFVDIDPSTALMSVGELEKKLKKAESDGKLPDVLIPVHLCGSSCDMKAIGELGKKYGFEIIEDASHAIGANYQDEPVGTCQYSSISVFSFHPVKIITTGEGGLATTNDERLAERMRKLRSHGITKNTKEFELEMQGPWSYEQQELGFNYRMTDIQAALGLSQLKRLEKIVEERQRQFKYYQLLLRNLPVRLLKIPKDAYSSVHLAVIRLEVRNQEIHLKLFEKLRTSGIGVQLHYSPIHLQPYYRKLGFKEGDYPAAESYAKDAMSLPLYPGLSRENQERVAKTIETTLREFG